MTPAVSRALEAYREAYRIYNQNPTHKGAGSAVCQAAENVISTAKDAALKELETVRRQVGEEAAEIREAEYFARKDRNAYEQGKADMVR